MAVRKSGKMNSRWMRGTPPTSVTFQSGTCGLRAAISAAVRVGTPPRQGTQVSWVRPAIVDLLEVRAAARANARPVRLRVLAAQRIDQGHRLAPVGGALVE